MKHMTILPINTLYGRFSCLNVKKSTFSNGDTTNICSNLFSGSHNCFGNITCLKTVNFFFRDFAFVLGNPNVLTRHICLLP